MDKLFIAFTAAIFLTGLVIYFLAEERAGVINATTEESTTSIESSSTALTVVTTQTSPATTSSTIKTVMDESTTTTAPLNRYIELNVTAVDKCRSTVNGMVSTVNAELSGESVSGNWGADPDPLFYFACDGGEMIEVDYVFFKGGRSIEPFDDVAGAYRLGLRCGRNQLVEEPGECGLLSILVDAAYVNASGIGSRAVESPFKELTSTTSTLMRENPYLEKFTGMGYRKADVKVAWLCPTCVPAVDRIVFGEPGVKSRSISYRQEINYVVYDPKKVSLDRILLLLNAGGTVKLLSDEEL